MGILNQFFRKQKVRVFVDGAIRPARQASGLGAVVLDDRGTICQWWHQRVGGMTNNQAEYEAAIMALQHLRHLNLQDVIVCSDSKVVVDQMQGNARVRNSGLAEPHQRLKELVDHFTNVTFCHIPREQNRLADALANEAVDRFPGFWK